MMLVIPRMSDPVRVIRVEEQHVVRAGEDAGAALRPAESAPAQEYEARLLVRLFRTFGMHARAADEVRDGDAQPFGDDAPRVHGGHCSAV
jgi:hypothetical protein